MWIPDRVLYFVTTKNNIHPDILATSGEHLRLWQIDSIRNQTVIKAELKNVRVMISCRQNKQNFQRH